MKKFFIAFVSAAVTSLTISSCQTASRTEPMIPLTKDQLTKLAERAKSPVMFGITVYPSDAGTIFAGSVRVHAAEAADVMLPAGGAPVVPVGPGGSDVVNALLDTSAPQSWVSLQGMRTLNMDLLAAPSLLEARPTHVFDTTSGYLAVAPHLKIKEVSMENVLMQMRGARGPIGPVARGLEKENINVVLGADTLKAFNHVQFNFPARYAIVSSTSDYRPVEANVIATVPLKFINGAVATDGALDGEATTFILDTGGDYGIALPTNRPSATVTQVNIGDLVVRDVPGRSGMDLGLGPIHDPRIGRQMLRRFKMTLDFHGRNIIFEKP